MTSCLLRIISSPAWLAFAFHSRRGSSRQAALPSLLAPILPFFDKKGYKKRKKESQRVSGLLKLQLPSSLLLSKLSPSVPHPSISRHCFPIVMKLISGSFPPSYQGGWVVVVVAVAVAGGYPSLCLYLDPGMLQV